MVAIKGLEMPVDCKKCPLMGTDGNPKDLLSPMMCVAIWATTHKIKHCVGGEILDDCPLVEIEEHKVGEWCKQNDDYFDWYECSECGYGSEGEMQYSSEYDVRTKYCPHCGAEMRGAENGENI